MPVAPVHGQEVPAGARPNHRGGVWCAHDHYRWEADQTADLGYCWAGGLQVYNNFSHLFIVPIPKKCLFGNCLSQC